MQKTLSLLAAFFAVLLLTEKQKKPFVSTKEPFCFSNVFCVHYFSKTKRNKIGYRLVMPSALKLYY